MPISELLRTQFSWLILPGKQKEIWLLRVLGSYIVLICIVLNHSEIVERMLEIECMAKYSECIKFFKCFYYTLYKDKFTSYLYSWCRSNFIMKNIKLADQIPGFQISTFILSICQPCARDTV